MTQNGLNAGETFQRAGALLLLHYLGCRSTQAPGMTRRLRLETGYPAGRHGSMPLRCSGQASSASREAPAESIGNRCAIENISSRVRHPGENSSDLATLFCLAVGATAIGGCAQAGQRRYWTVDYAKHLSKSDTIRGDEQRIAAELTASALHNAITLKLQQNMLKELARDPFLRRDVWDHHRFGASKSEESVKSVSSLLRDQSTSPL
jgi:hypothetical protein